MNLFITFTFIYFILYEQIIVVVFNEIKWKIFNSLLFWIIAALKLVMDMDNNKHLDQIIQVIQPEIVII